MDAISRSVFIPVMLVLDVWVFQYLVGVYYSRRKEFRVRSLLLAALLGFVTQVYSHDNREMALELNNISETSLQLTFVTQITLIGRAVCKKVKLRSIFYFTYTAEALVVLGWLNVVGTILEVSDVIKGDVVSLIGNVLESTSLIFVMVFRFYYLSPTHGLKTVLEERKFEMFLYVLLVIHEFPFMMLEYYTGVTWEFAQGIGNRVFVVACIVQNIRHKAISSRSSSKSNNKNCAAGRLRAHIRAIHAVVGALNGHWKPILFHIEGGSAQFVLFFDGGSRGNPGPGGSGAVIRKVDSDSNTAKLSGRLACRTRHQLLQITKRSTGQGLLHAQRTPTLRPLHVVGDSQLILRQQLHRTAPKAPFAHFVSKMQSDCRQMWCSIMVSLKEVRKGRSLRRVDSAGDSSPLRKVYLRMRTHLEQRLRTNMDRGIPLGDVGLDL